MRPIKMAYHFHDISVKVNKFVYEILLLSEERHVCLPPPSLAPLCRRSLGNAPSLFVPQLKKNLSQIPVTNNTIGVIDFAGVGVFTEEL